MNQPIYEFILTLAGIILMGLLAIIAYFLKKWIDSTDSLTKSVTTLEKTVALLQLNQGNTEKVCLNTHGALDKQLAGHSKSINEHSEILHEHTQSIAKLNEEKSTRRYVKRKP